MKKFFYLAVVVTMLAACNQNKPDSPEEQKKTEFAKAKYFEVIGINTVPSENYTQDSVRALAYLTDEGAVIELYGVGFSERMPITIDMNIEDINYSRSGEQITLSGDSIIPLMGSRPFDRYMITGLKGYITADSLVFTNNYGSYENCKFAGKMVKMEEKALNTNDAK